MNKQEIEVFLEECYENIEKVADENYNEEFRKAVIKANLLYFYSQMQSRFMDNHNLRKFEENKQILTSCIELHNGHAVFVNNYSQSIKPK